MDRRIGPYLLREELAAGAFSVTYRAEHAELGRAALIKTLKATVTPGGALAAALEREARVLARFHHPSIVEIQDLRREGGALWLALEPVPGPTLAELLKRAGRLDPGAAAGIALEIARGLGHAHERGVVHCALCPEHVVVTPGGGVKIVDFSAAQEVARGTPAAASSAAPGERAEPFEALRPGPLDYLAPEQILGEAPGPQADVFALGVLLYEMLAGHRPFEPPREPELPAARGPTPARGAQASSRVVAHRIRHEPPPPLRELTPEVPRGIEQVALRCLEKEPDQRFADGHVTASALEEALAEQGYAPGAGRALVARALSAAKLGGEAPAPELPAPASPVPPAQRGRGLLLEARPLAAVLALMVAGGVVIELGLRERDEPASPGVAADPAVAPGQRGHLRVLARPWAEVILDGEPLDVTPIGRPIPVAPGRHYVTFRHPNAPEEKREILVAPGQTVVVDVSMRVERAAPDAGADADAGESP